ncbi:TolC family protein [Acidomonas methanolica]|uniref:TolC family protein n=1 Tax=Acidomonas methanolica TaxID=437 RepID=UPI00211A64E2|nr:TolC family protein [Acidomonas methanolica]
MFLVLYSPQIRAESIHDAISSAWARDPATASAKIDRQAAHETAKALDAPFPSGPILNGQYLDDHFIGSNLGYTTYQGSISMPLWLPGQKTARVGEAEAGVAVADARIQVQRLLVAIHVLDLTGAAAALSREIANLREAGTLLGKTLAASRDALRAGELALADEEAIAAEKADIEGRIVERRQKLAVARAGLEMLTGSRRIPDLLAIDGRVLAQRRLDPMRDPRIALANALNRETRESFTLARHSYMPNPRVGLMVSRQGQYDSPWDTQVGVQFQVALPSRARNAPLLMKSVRAVAASRRNAELARRKVRVEYRRVRAQMASAIKILRYSGGAHDALEARASQLDAGWRAGEVSVIAYLRARRAELQARQRMTQANVIWRVSLIRMLLMSGQTL